MFHPLFAAVLTVALTGPPAAARPPAVSSCDAPEIAAGTYIDLDIDIPGARAITLVAINERGDIAGFFVDEAERTESFLLRQGEITVLAVPGADATRVTGINASGTLVGVYHLASRQHAFTWNRGQFTLYEPSPWMRSLTFAAINASGAIVGSYGEGEGEKAFVLRGSRLELIDIGRRWTFAVSINARGDLLLIGQNLPGPGRASHFLVTRRGIEGLVGCDGLGGFLGGQLWTVTNQGDLVGRMGPPTLPEFGGYSGVVYSERGVTVFNYPGAISTELLGMNSAGYAIGRAWSLTWHRHFLFIPHGQ